MTKLFEKDDKVYALVGNELKPGVVLKKIKEGRVLVKILMNKPSNKTKTVVNMRCNTDDLVIRTSGPITI